MRRLTIFITFSFCFVGAVLWMSQSFFTSWEPFVRRQLEQRAGAALKAKVEIDSLSLPFLHRLSAKNVRLSEPGPGGALLFRAAEISLTFSLIDLPRALWRRQPIETIGLVSVKAPTLILSPSALSRLQPKKDRRATQLPPLFTLVWDEGTFQWKDPAAPHGAWTLYGARGIYRIRGPKMNLSIRGSLEQAQTVRVDAGTLFGRRWSFQAAVKGGNIRGVLNLAEHFAHRPLLPAEWKIAGGFDLDVKGSGRGAWPKGRRWASALQEGKLKLSNVHLQAHPSAPAVSIDGGLRLKGPEITASNLTVTAEGETLAVNGRLLPFSAPPRLDVKATAKAFELSSLPRVFRGPGFIDGKAEMTATVSGPLSDPEIKLDATVPQGRILRWAFTDGVLVLERSGGLWTFGESALNLLGGSVRLHGGVGTSAQELKVIADNVALPQLFGPAVPFLRGQLRASAVLHGPPAAIQGTASFWVSKFSIGEADPQELEGSAEVTDGRLHVQAGGGEGQTRLTLRASHEGPLWSLDQFDLRLTGGGSLTGSGQYRSDHDALAGSVEATRIAVPTDVPVLKRWVPNLQGRISAQGSVSGPLHDPVLAGTLAVREASIDGKGAAEADSPFVWQKELLTLDGFKTNNGVAGVWHQQLVKPFGWDIRLELSEAPGDWLSAVIFKHHLFAGPVSGSVLLGDRPALFGEGHVSLHDGSFGAWPVKRADVVYAMKADQFDLKRLAVDGHYTSADGRGRAVWTPGKPGHPVQNVNFRLDATAGSDAKGDVWQAPLEITGSFNPSEQWRGRAQFVADRVAVRHQASAPFSMTMTWDPTHVGWQKVHWGPEWNGDALIRFLRPGLPPIVQAHLKGTKAVLSTWADWIAPHNKERLEGLLNLDLVVAGTTEAPAVAVSGDVAKGRWRAFNFAKTFQAQWTKAGWKEVQARAEIVQGGTVEFSGAWDRANGPGQGTLSIQKLNLKPLAESVGLPQPTEGFVSASLTPAGTPANPQWKGRVEASPLIYAAGTDHPFPFERIETDVAIAPAPDRHSVTRATFSNLLVKTPEEQIRVADGAFIEAAEQGAPARIEASAQVRNLHLGVFTLFGALGFSGTWQIKPTGFAIQATAETRGLFINDYELERGRLIADYDGGVLRFHRVPTGPSLVTGTVDFHEAPQLRFDQFAIAGADQRGLSLNGVVGPKKWDFSMTGQGLDLAALAGLAGFPYSLIGTVDTAIRGTGDVDHPQVEGRISIRDGRALGLRFKTGESQVLWQNERMTFTHLLLSDPGRYTLRGAGVFPVAARSGRKSLDRRIDFSLRLEESNLGLLKSFSEEVKEARGDIEGLLQITGTLDQPTLRGNLRINAGDIVGAHYFKRLKNLSLDAVFDKDQFVLRELKGRSGEGVLKAGGTISFAGFEPRAYDLKAEVVSPKGLSIQVPELAIPESPLSKRFRFLTTASYADVKGYATLRGAAESPVFEGDVTLSNGHFTFPPSEKNATSGAAAILEWFRRISWDVVLRFLDGAWFENELVEANLLGSLRLKGSSDRLRVDGGMDITEGKISYLGVEFDLREGRFDVRSNDSGPAIVNTPYVRGIGESHVQALDTVSGLAGSDPSQRLDISDTVTLTVDYAPVDQIKPRLVSANNPTLSQEKVLTRVAQLDTQNLNPQERNYLYQQQMVRLIDTSLATPLAKRLLKPTGLVDTVRVSRVIDPASSNLSDVSPNNTTQTQQSVSLLANTKYTFEKNLNSRLSLGYGVRFVENVQPETLQNKLDLINDVELNYRWFRNVYLRSVFDLPNKNPNFVPDRRVTVEPRWRFGWWGNTNKDKMRKPTVPVTPAEK